MRPISITPTPDLHRDDRHRTAEKLPERTPRSRCDRTAIALRSHRDRAAITLIRREIRRLDRYASSGGDWGNINCTIDPDRDAIVARSWPDRPAIGADLPRN